MSGISISPFLDDDEEEIEILVCKCQNTAFFIHVQTSIAECVACGRPCDNYVLVRKH